MTLSLNVKQNPFESMIIGKDIKFDKYVSYFIANLILKKYKTLRSCEFSSLEALGEDRRHTTDNFILDTVYLETKIQLENAQFSAIVLGGCCGC